MGVEGSPWAKDWVPLLGGPVLVVMIYSGYRGGHPSYAKPCID